MKYILACLSILISTAVFADNCSTWGCVSTVEDLYTNANGYVYVSTPLDETKANCTVYPGNYFVLNPAAQNFKEVYASLLAAFMSDKKIQIRIVEGSPRCEISYVRLSKKQ